jgi:NAD(P)-dependent dehydrogenase (short-subunit alcohol dehydrogenase family)
MQIKGTVALVTGANRGIGAALVRGLLDRGASKVYATARRREDLANLDAADHRIMPVRLDVTDASQLAELRDRVKDVNILFNNAGVLSLGSVLDASPEAFSQTFDVNFFGPLNTTRALAPALAQHDGAVVNILTVAALASIPGLGVYNASKAAAWSLTQSLRADLAKRGVKVFSVFPGPVDTDMARGFDMAKTPPALVAEEVLNGVEAGDEDIFPDPISRQLYAQWAADHKALEHQFATI